MLYFTKSSVVISCESKAFSVSAFFEFIWLHTSEYRQHKDTLMTQTRTIFFFVWCYYRSLCEMKLNINWNFTSFKGHSSFYILVYNFSLIYHSPYEHQRMVIYVCFTCPVHNTLIIFPFEGTFAQNVQFCTNLTFTLLTWSTIWSFTS